MNLESPSKIVEQSAETIYNFLTNIENFETLMPENTRFEKINETRFLFALKGMPEIVLDLKEGTPHSKIVLGAASDKLPFTLTGNIAAIDAQRSEVGLVFEGEFNSMMSMMIKAPITKFIETLVSNMDRVV